MRFWNKPEFFSALHEEGFTGGLVIEREARNPLARVVAVCDAVRMPVDGVLSGVSGNVKNSDDIHLGRDVKIFQNLEDLLADPGHPTRGSLHADSIASGASHRQPPGRQTRDLRETPGAHLGRRPGNPQSGGKLTGHVDAGDMHALLAQLALAQASGD